MEDFFESVADVRNHVFRQAIEIEPFESVVLLRFHIRWNARPFGAEEVEKELLPVLIPVVHHERSIPIPLPRYDTGLFEKLPFRTMGNGLSNIETTCGNGPIPIHAPSVGTADQEDFGIRTVKQENVRSDGKRGVHRMTVSVEVRIYLDGIP